MARNTDRNGSVTQAMLVALSFVACGACATTLSDRASRVRWADSPQQVADCESLGMVEGSSAQTGAANISTGRNNARNEALERAASRGATHVRWLENNEGFSGIHITAEAFNCGEQRTTRVARVPDNDARDEAPPARHVKKSNADADETADGKPNDRIREHHDVDATAMSPSISTGTCFFVSATGLALSSLHVVRDTKKIFVIDATGRRSGATVLAKDERLDLVALQVEQDVVPQVLSVSDQEATLGDHVFTLGFPEVVDLGFDPKLTEGSISGERGLGLDFLLQTSTPVQPGNSGGALIDDGGRVVGIVALRQNYFSDGTSAINTAFAVKATSVRKAFRSLSISSAGGAKDRKASIARARAAACLVVGTDQDLPVAK